MTAEAPRFPIGLTFATAVAVAIMIGLGVWQLQRLDWKHRELARIAQLQHAPPVPIGPVLTSAAAGANVDYARVTAVCARAAPAAPAFHMTTDNGDWVARARSPCVVAAGPYDGVVVDRGFVTATRGQTDPPSVTLPAPVQVTGVLFVSAQDAAPPLRHPAPVVLVVESETPPLAGVAPAPYPGDAADRFHYVGAYWLVWFGLAGALAAIYAAVLFLRFYFRPKLLELLRFYFRPKQ